MRTSYEVFDHFTVFGFFFVGKLNVKNCRKLLRGVSLAKHLRVNISVSFETIVKKIVIALKRLLGSSLLDWKRSGIDSLKKHQKLIFLLKPINKFRGLEICIKKSSKRL